MAEYSEDEIRATYPQLAYLIGHPEIGSILRQAHEGDWAPDKFQAAIMATDWWRTTSDSTRKFDLKRASDPASLVEEVNAARHVVQRIGGSLGWALGPEAIEHFATLAVREGLDATALQARIADFSAPWFQNQERSPILSAIRKASQDWGFAAGPDFIAEWTKELGSGRQTAENMELALREHTVAAFPHLKGQFDQGMTMRQVTDPYRKLIADTLEIDAEGIDFWNDARWRTVVAQPDAKSGFRVMSTVEAAKHARSQPEWERTKNYQDRTDGVLRDLRGVFQGG